MHRGTYVRAVAIPTMCQENLKQDLCYSYGITIITMALDFPSA